MNINYIGEHLLAGDLGKLFVWLGFGAAVLASVFYFMAYYKKEKRPGWIRAARGFYLTHTASVIAVSAVLFYIIFNHYFEYAYVWQYSSKELATKYIVSCFWAGQEGSFLVWALWQALIGVFVLWLSRKWEAPVMFIFSISQAFVTSMLLGTSILGVTIGETPFELLRESVGNIEGTIFTMPDYVRHLTDGNGLNPLLENIWMTIHPPILFLGYALALVPFSYAIASFMVRDYHTWISRALPWTLLSLLMLGAGILLGGAWAYVSLTFGGFWAWDPVENSSLVPWMTMIAGLHFMLIARRQNYALLAAYVLITLSYVLILYASFLTRSGVLADTSVHSFGENGMSTQLLVYLLVFFFMMIVMIGLNVRKFQTIREDNLLSREFWMFIGSIIMVLAAFQIIFTTSIPVFNGLFNTSIAPPVDPIGFYNRWQMPYALLISGFIAFTQLMNYRENEPGQFLKKMLFPLGAAIIFCIPMIVAGVVTQLNFILLVFFTLFALFAALYNMFFLSIRPKNPAAIVAHIGFVVFILGTVITFSNSKVISSNTSQYDLGNQRDNAENLVLMRNDTVFMSGFYVSYVHNKSQGNTTIYQVDFMKKENGKYLLDFSLHPSVNIHPKMGAVYNPDTKHFPGSDFYTYIAIVSKEPDYIVIKAIMNPYINVLWLGSVVMLAGLGMAFVRRARNRWLGNS